MYNAETIRRLIANDLLSIKAVFLRPEEPFTWASGIKSPVYCDNRLTLTAPKVRNDVENGLCELIRKLNEMGSGDTLMNVMLGGVDENGEALPGEDSVEDGDPFDDDDSWD